MSSGAKIEKMLKKISNDLEKLKVVARISETEPKKSKTKDRPTCIDYCTKKSQLALFTVAELKAWLVGKKADKLSGLTKDELIKKVVKKLKEARPTSSAESSSGPSAPTCTEVTSAMKASSVDDIDDLIEPSELSHETASQNLIAEIMKLIARSTNN